MHTRSKGAALDLCILGQKAQHKLPFPPAALDLCIFGQKAQHLYSALYTTRPFEHEEGGPGLVSNVRRRSAIEKI